jgi:nucleotide-binding universal stress UspA family protein
MVKVGDKPLEPAGQRVDAAVFDQVVVPVDETTASERAWPHAVALAEQADCPLRLVTVAAGSTRRDDAERRLDELAAGASRDAVSCEVIVGTDPAAEIIATVSQRPRSVIAMATRAPGAIGELVFGSVTSAVLRDAGCPLLLVGPRCEPPSLAPRRLLVCLDGSQVATAILPVARNLAATGLQARLFHVIYPPVDPITRAAELSREDKEMYSLLAEQTAAWERDGLQVDWRIESGTVPAETIITEATPATMIAMATHGRTALARMLVGSVTNQVVKNSRVPVLTLRPSASLH